MFGFLKKYPPAIGSLDALGVDMHAHWLPGIDDGAQNLGESLTIIRNLVSLGYRKLIATPHVMADLYPNTSAGIREKLELTRTAARQEGIEVELDAAAEYLLDEGFMERLEQDDLLTLPNKHVLVEFSFVSAPPTLDEIFFKLQSRGYVVVLAHPERYHYYHANLEVYRRLVAKGIKLQVNLLSLTGYYGGSVKKVAQELIDRGWVGILGTDAHHVRHLAELQKLVGSGKFSQPIGAHNWHNQALFG